MIGATLALLVVVGLAYYTTFVEPFDLRLTTVSAPVVDLPAAFDGYTIAFLSDFHCGPASPARHAR